MIKLSILFSLFLVSLSSVAQTPTIEWAKCYGGSEADKAYSIMENGSGFLITGWSASADGDISSDPGTDDGSFMSIDSSGNLLWERTLGGSYGDYLYAANRTNDRGYIVLGYSVGSPDGDVGGTHGFFSSDVWIVKLDSNRNVIWKETYGGNDEESTTKRNNIEQTSDSGFIFIAESASADGDVIGAHSCNGCSYDMWVVKLNSQGVIQWQKPLGGTQNESSHQVHQTSDGGYIVCGMTFSTDGDITYNHGGADAWVVKLDSSGNIEWQKCYGGTIHEYFVQIRETSDSGYICIGGTSSNDGDVSGNHGGGEDIWLVKINHTGTLQWQKCIGTTGTQFATDMDLTEDGGVVFTYLGDNLVDFAVMKTDSMGNVEWQKYAGGSAQEFAYSVKQTDDGGFIMTGYTNSADGDVSGIHGNLFCDGFLHCFDYWVVKLSAEGVNVAEEKQTLETFAFSDSEKSQLLIQLTMFAKRMVTIHLMDLSGRVIYSEVFNANVGYNEFHMPMTFLTSGLYLVNLNDGMHSITKRVVK